MRSARAPEEKGYARRHNHDLFNLVAGRARGRSSSRRHHQRRSNALPGTGDSISPRYISCQIASCFHAVVYVSARPSTQTSYQPLESMECRHATARISRDNGAYPRSPACRVETLRGSAVFDFDETQANIASPLKRLAAALSFCIVVSGASAAEEASRTSAEFSLLSYNVHGISWVFAKDDPQQRAAAIGWLANRYDVVLLQEDFDYHDEIGKQMTGTVALQGNGMRGDLRLVAVKLLLLPFHVVLPDFSFPYGSGLSIFVASEIAAVVESSARAFRGCNGWFKNSYDCWSSKGILRARIRLANGAEIDVYDTHLDAGQSGAGLRLRERQLAELADLIDASSPGRAVIVAGDFNTMLNRMENVESMRFFKQRTGLVDIGAGPDLPQWPRRDYILVRDGLDVTIKPLEAGEALEFVNRDRALSDHPAVYARFEVERK
jgi:endonuclease/exonuclease/phosphatase family metal-dependent hydrolase